MVQCSICGAETRKIDATIYLCTEWEKCVVHEFGLEKMLKAIGIDEKIIKKIYDRIEKTKLAHCI